VRIAPIIEKIIENALPQKTRYTSSIVGWNSGLAAILGPNEQKIQKLNLTEGVATLIISKKNTQSLNQGKNNLSGSNIFVLIAEDGIELFPPAGIYKIKIWDTSSIKTCRYCCFQKFRIEFLGKEV